MRYDLLSWRRERGLRAVVSLLFFFLLLVVVVVVCSFYLVVLGSIIIIVSIASFLVVVVLVSYAIQVVCECSCFFSISSALFLFYSPPLLFILAVYLSILSFLVARGLAVNI